MDFKKIAKGLDLEEDEYMDLIRLFVETTEANLQDLESSIKAQDSEAVFKMAHKIKGAALNLELADVASLAKEIEFKGRNNQLTDTSPLFGELKKSFVKISALTAQ